MESAGASVWALCATGKESFMEFAGQTAIVTGSARGFGRAICRRLAQGDARVVVADINLPE